jgi:CBS domain-containing protein
MKIEYLLRPEALTCAPTDTLVAVARRMRDHEVSALAVVSSDRLVGMISTRHLVRAVADGANLDSAVVQDYSAPVHYAAEPGEETRHVAQRMLDTGLDHIPILDGTTVINVVPLRHLVAVEPRLGPERAGPAPDRAVVTAPVHEHASGRVPRRRWSTTRRRARCSTKRPATRTRHLPADEPTHVGDAAWWLEGGGWERSTPTTAECGT